MLTFFLTPLSFRLQKHHSGSFYHLLPKRNPGSLPAYGQNGASPLIGYKPGQNVSPSAFLSPLQRNPPYKRSRLPETQKSSDILLVCTPSHQSKSELPYFYNALAPQQKFSAALCASSLLLPFYFFLLPFTPSPFRENKPLCILIYPSEINW